MTIDERTVWILTGGWEGHRPEAMASVLEEKLTGLGFSVVIQRDLACLADAVELRRVALVIPNWTGGHVSHAVMAPFLEAVRNGLGVAGVHGGMADTFRLENEYHHLVGGQFVAHPGGDGVTYDVHVLRDAHLISASIPDFVVTTEKYYMHVDSAVTVLATTQFGDVRMPVAWVKTYGRGRVFYCTLGHDPSLLQSPPIDEFLDRGFVWASRQ